MKRLTEKLKRLVGKALAFFPYKLPVGITEFNRFSDRIFFTYQLPNLPSYKQAIAASIMHLPTHTTRKSPRWFAIGIRKAMANQIAYEVIYEIKEREKKEKESIVSSLTQNKPGEATASTQAAHEPISVAQV